MQEISKYSYQSIAAQPAVLQSVVADDIGDNENKDILRPPTEVIEVVSAREERKPHGTLVVASIVDVENEDRKTRQGITC